jgi:hypothetical protein
MIRNLKSLFFSGRRIPLIFYVSVYFICFLVAVPAIAFENNCWGQATAVFAQMGEMGEHASQQANPRLGLANLARALFDAGVISEPSVSALGVFVNEQLQLEIESCRNDSLAVSQAESAIAAQAACWGQATAVFAQMGEMGEHASQQANPRLGLRNLAKALYEEGVIYEPTLAALGEFVASALELTIDACN